MDETLRVVVVALVAFVAGIGAHKYLPDELDRFKRPANEEELQTLGDKLRKESEAYALMATVADRLALGEDPNRIISELPPELQKRWEEYDL